MSSVVSRLIALALLPAVSAVVVATDEAVNRFQDVDYVEGASEADRRKLDVYTSRDSDTAAAKRPVVIFLHGGGWIRGDRKRVHHKAEWLVDEGFVFVSVGYRLASPSGAGGHPENVADVAAAVAWLHANVGEYGGDPGRMFVIGHSAGAHLAALVATDGRHLGRHGLSPELLAGVVVIDTDAFDIERLIAEVEPEARPLYLAAFGRRPDGWRDASPIAHLGDGEPSPPFLVLLAGHSRRKDAQVSAFRRRLAAADVPVRVERFRRETHGSISARMGLAGHAPSAVMLGFLKGQGP